MGAAVFAPLVLTLVVAALSRFAAPRLRPQVAARAITVAAVAVAVSAVGALVLLACPLPARIPFVADLGSWRPESVALRTPVPAWLSCVGLVVLAWLGWRVLRASRLLRGAFRDLLAAHDELVGCGGGEVVVLDDPTPRAHAVSRTLTRHGRVLLTSGMLEMLDNEERAAVVAHERAHLRHRHAVFVVLVQLAAALNPGLTTMRGDLRFSLERWADEEGADLTHRSVMASALAKAALATLHHATLTTGMAFMGLYTHGVNDRVVALLEQRRQPARLAWALMAVAVLAAAALVWAGLDTERFFETVRTWHHR